MDKKEKSKKKGSPKKYSSNKIVKAVWIVFGSGILLTFILFILINAGIIGYIPPIDNLQNPIDKYASQVYSADGEVLGTFSLEKNNRIYSDFSELPPYLVNGLVATEDIRYYDHSGIDIKGMIRAIVKTLSGQKTSGGSTLSQQLIKQLYSPPAESLLERVLQKPVEWVIAVKLERFYTKEEIISLYLNKYDFGNNAVGIQSAAQVYFNKKPRDLKVEEAAMLVGMCNNSSLYNPRLKHRVDTTKHRRNVVLSQMFKYGYITKQQFDSLRLLPMTLNFRQASHNAGLAPYTREYLRLTMSAKKPEAKDYFAWQKDQYTRDSISWLNDPLYGWCNKNKKPDGSNYNLVTDGLKIYTTIDSRMQQYAEEAMTEHLSKEIQPKFDKQNKGRSYAPFAYAERNNIDTFLYSAMKVTDRYRKMKKAGKSEIDIYKVFQEPAEMKVFSWRGEIDTIMTPWDSIRYHKGILRSGFMAMDTHTGYVKAYVGGIDFKYFKYDMVNQGRRQVGSTIKPYLYTLAMEEGFTPCDEMLHVEQILHDENGREYRPKNATPRRVGEMVSIKWGLQMSDNWVTAYLMSKTSPYTFAQLLHSFGITGRIDAVVSMALGTHDVSVSEMAAAYTAFANKGLRARPRYVTRIEDSYGNIIANDEFLPTHAEVFSLGAYVKMLDMLRGVMDGGTGGRVRRNYGITAPMGGKTGTTQKNSDGWFMAFTPSLSAGCWVGGEDRSVRFDRTADGQGASTALPIFGLFMKKVYADKELGYSQTEQFETVKGYSVCDKSTEELPESNTVKIDDIFN
ncbi:MAG: transglycosylase domain-containing protein [Prevotella sp.]|jgi:penicillin-binding protein 1A|nr:transglycosylase domain-containing protein [Prevotella sp.]